MANNIQILHSEFPSNSKNSRNTNDGKDEKKVEKVVTSGVTVVKKPWYKRATEAFFGEDVENVGSYIILDVLVPAIKNTIADMVSNGIDMLMFGDRGRSRTNYGGSRSYYNYSTAYRSDSRDRDRTSSYRSRSSSNIENIVCEERRDAEQVIDELCEYIDRYGQVTVADLYDLVGMTTTFTDNNWGWTNLGSARVDRVSGGYLINLPKPISLR